MATDDMKVRVEERLKIKIGEAKNLQCRNGNSIHRDVYCTISLDQEEIFRTSTIEKTLNPFFGQEFQFEVPRTFRHLSVYVYDRDRHLKQDKVLGKVAIKREDLANYNNRDHWFAIRPVDADSEVQGKANIELQFEQPRSALVGGGCGGGSSLGCNFTPNKRLAVRVIECVDLTLRNGSCDPYVQVCVVFSNDKLHCKRTKVRKKTACPEYDETFVFDASEEGRERGGDVVCPETDVEICELQVSVWHNAVGGDIFLGEFRVPLRGLQQQNKAPKNAWYLLQPRSSKNKPNNSCSTPPGTRLSIDNSLGSLRLQVQYNADHVFESKVYAPLRALLLNSVRARPITSSAVYILGEVITSKMDVAQPLVRIFMHHRQIVPLIRALADAEIANLTDPTTIFRGNTLVSKMMDEAMRMIGLQYLHKTLRPILEQVFNEKKPCEIDPSRVRDANTIQQNSANLKNYVQSVFRAITESAVDCPALMCQIFHTLKECAMSYFPDNREVRYSVISGFIFLRFFAPAILGPRLFDLTNEQFDRQTNRTLTLMSKTIQSLSNLGSCRSTQQVCKEEYMEVIYKEFCTESHVRAVRQFLEIISANSNTHMPLVDTPVTLKEGNMIKRAQGRRRFGRKNFKQRYFKLTTHDLSYAKNKGREPLWRIPLSNILAVERLQERSFKMQNMFQILQQERVLYVQAPNCVEAKEWIDLLTKIVQTNSNRLDRYHPCAFIDGQWLCCKSTIESSEGCTEVSAKESNNLHMTLDPERDLQRMHSLVILHCNRLESLQNMCQVYNETMQSNTKPFIAEDLEGCYNTIQQLLDCAFNIEQRHRSYQRTLVRDTVRGSKAAPIGDDNYLHASRMNLDSFMRTRREDL